MSVVSSRESNYLRALGSNDIYISSDDEFEPAMNQGRVNSSVAMMFRGHIDLQIDPLLCNDDDELTLLAVHTDSLVFPGIVIQLSSFSRLDQNQLLSFFTKRNVFVLVSTVETNDEIYKYGLLMEVVYNIIKYNTSLYIKAKVCQRCEILPDQVWNFDDSVQLNKAKVKLIKDSTVISPIYNTELYALKRLSPNYDGMFDNYKNRRYHLGQFTHASWVYDRHEVSYYFKLLHSELVKYYQTEDIPTEPTALSYWFIHTFFLTEEEQVKLITLNSTFERLQLEHEFLHKERMICCPNCETPIANQKHMFVIPKSSPTKPSYDFVSVNEAKNYRRDLYCVAQERSYTFIGYTSSAISCDFCVTSIGTVYSYDTDPEIKFFTFGKYHFHVISTDQNNKM